MFVAKVRRSEVFYPDPVRPGDKIDLQEYVDNDVICDLVARGHYTPILIEIEDEELLDMLEEIQGG